MDEMLGKGVLFGAVTSQRAQVACECDTVSTLSFADKASCDFAPSANRVTLCSRFMHGTLERVSPGCKNGESKIFPRLVTREF